MARDNLKSVFFQSLHFRIWFYLKTNKMENANILMLSHWKTLKPVRIPEIKGQLHSICYSSLKWFMAKS